MKKFLIIFLAVFLFANNKIESLLKQIEINEDLSSKTKKENAGILEIFTRSDIERMKATKLKDILKVLSPFFYSRNKFNLPDPFLPNATSPNNSNFIRLYIDNHEITSGPFGSGIVIYGNMDINNIDHIEVYKTSPSFDMSVEPGFIIIKMYTKDYQRDLGKKIGLSFDNYYSKEGYFYQAFDKKFIYFDANNYKTKSIKNLKKDFNSIHFFSSYKKDNSEYFIDYINIPKYDNFIGLSPFATPKTNYTKIQNLLLAYNKNFDNINFKIDYQFFKNNYQFEDKNKQKIQFLNSTYKKNLIYQVNSKLKSHTLTSSLTYTNKLNNNDFTVGIKSRYNTYYYDTLTINNKSQKTKTNPQLTNTLFIEERYFINNKTILGGGIAHYHINTYSYQTNNILNHRIFFTHLNNNYIYKLYHSNIKTLPPSYIIGNPSFLETPNQKIKPMRELYTIFEITKKDTSSKTIRVFKGEAKNALIPNNEGKLYVTNKRFKYKTVSFIYKKNITPLSKINLKIGITHIKGFNVSNVYRLLERYFVSYNKFDLFEYLKMERSTLIKKYYTNLGGAITYHKNDNLSFAIKIDNLLNKAKQLNYYALDENTLQHKTIKDFNIERKIEILMEYTF